MPTVHNPTHFDPADYEVEDYLDNQRPVYFGQGLPAHELEIAAWTADMVRIFGAGYPKKIHKCIHCGNGSVRWITAVRHKPTDSVVVFGAVCTDRRGFANKHAFKLAQLQARANARKVRFTIWTKRQEFLDAHPAIVQALTEVDKPEHARNVFAKDVLAKLDQYGTLSDRQVTTLLESLARDTAYVARKAVEETEPKGAAPSGRVEVTGTVLSIKEQEGYGYAGPVWKMLLKLENNSKVWVTCTSTDICRGDKVTVKATWTVSATDPSFAFGKRPVVVNHDAYDKSLPPVRAQRTEGAQG